MRTQSNLYYILFGSILLLSSCSRGSGGPEGRSFPVEVGEAVQKDVPVYIETIGKVEAFYTVEIRPQVGGVISHAFVNEGQYVKKGDPIFQIDPRAYQAELDQAKANLARDEASLKFAKIKLERNKELVKADYLSKLSYEQFQSEVIAAGGVVLGDKAALARAKLNLEWSSIVSPIDGVVSLFQIDPGNLVIAYATESLASIRQINPVTIRFSITQKEFIQLQQAVKEGTLRLQASLPQNEGGPKEGRLRFIDNQIDPNTGTISLKGEIVNDDAFFWPGEFVRVLLKLKEQKNAIIVPEEAVQSGHMGPYVYIFDPSSSTVELRPVKTGTKVDHHVVIEEGVKAKEQIVLKGQINLRPKAKVHISNKESL